VSAEHSGVTAPVRENPLPNFIAGTGNGNHGEPSGQTDIFKTPRPADEMYRDALAHANAGNTDEAIRQLETILEEYVDFAVAHNDLGVLYQQKCDVQRSRHHHEEAVRLKPAGVIFQKNLADLLCVEFGDLEEALKIYVRLQAKAPQDIEILKAIANICREAGKPVDARFFLERILTLQPWDRDAQEMLKMMEEADKACESR
jgi:Flp pilus assembly protein TadD